ncbi:MAG TPA: hypothetical protein PKC73_06925 [Dermatophilaceae bacterium]|nr:hypothetical protein [Dermatophilaceae bacterium]
MSRFFVSSGLGPPGRQVVGAAVGAEPGEVCRAVTDRHTPG